MKSNIISKGWNWKKNMNSISYPCPNYDLLHATSFVFNYFNIIIINNIIIILIIWSYSSGLFVRVTVITGC